MHKIRCYFLLTLLRILCKTRIKSCIFLALFSSYNEKGEKPSNPNLKYIYIYISFEKIHKFEVYFFYESEQAQC
jgi:hypothetical protein